MTWLIVENPPLARALHATVEIDQEIPVEHYKAVAEVIGTILRLRRRSGITVILEVVGSSWLTQDDTPPGAPIDRSERPGHIGLVLLLAGVLVGAIIGLRFRRQPIRRSR